MAKKTEDKKKVFNFGESPLVKKTEQTVVEGYQRIEDGEQGERLRVGNGTSGMGEKPTEPVVAPQVTEPEPAVSQPTEETKGIQAYIPMSLYERLVMRKLKTKESLGSMFQQAIQLWIDVQEGKKSVVKA